MSEDCTLIIIKGENKTEEVKQIEWDGEEKKYKIKYLNSNKVYKYKYEDVDIQKFIENINIGDNILCYKDKMIGNVKKAIRYQDSVKVIYTDGSNSIFYNGYEITVKKSSSKKDIIEKDIIGYYKEIAKYAKIKDENKANYNSNRTFLEEEYSKLNYVPADSVLECFLNKKKLSKPEIEKEKIIYPFRFNLSQKEAINNAYKSNISIIEGPPGTGKTQTILNIIANLAIMQNKTVAVVSNNNEAVKNVKDKLKQGGYEFIIADLGNKDKRKKFFEELPHPQIGGFSLDIKERDKLEKQIGRLNRILDSLLQKKNRQAQLEKEIYEYKLEQDYFNKYYEKQNIAEINKLSFYNKTDDRIIQFLLDTQMWIDNKVQFEWMYKIKLLLKYGIKDLKELDKNIIENILLLQKEFYEIKIQNLEQELKGINHTLDKHKFEELQEKHQIASEKLFKNKIHDRYIHLNNGEFTYKNYQYKIKKFLKSYPIVLSTTYSLRNSIPHDYIFDYVIIDESSQVDLTTGVLAISCAKNAIIVGDTKQLPQIVDMKIQEKISNSDIEPCYDYFQNNILSSFLKIYGDKIPRKVLREHYRCHPKIIEFCNKRYYNGELIAFANDEHNSIKKPLVIYYTVKGNHLRKLTEGDIKGTYNARELEVIKKEVLVDERVKNFKNEEIGITTPYRLQADLMQNVDENIQSDTIHKFQGREKKLMILSTVLDNSKNGKQGLGFVDDACMVNVAVSRAIDQFVVVTDNKLFNEYGKEIKSLLKYIKYNEMDSEIIESQIVSVFDLLYKEYSKKLNGLSKNLLHRRKYKSEDIMDTILYNEFLKEDYRDYKYTGEYLLRELLKDVDNLNDNERQYINNRASVDFVIFNKMDNKPVLLIEVDGFQFHANKPEQLVKDEMKNNIARKNNIKLLRFETGGKAYDQNYIINEIRNALFL
ncbi:MAG: AAA family ATPase [Clostridia bacterium]|nr:AAA family ATPase [Clostridia bacterium]